MYSLVVALGGAVGSLARYWMTLAALPVSRSLPVGTILINVLGSFAIGFVGTLTLKTGRYPAPETLRLFFMVGVCGGFTTFSSFSLQTLELLRNGAAFRALLNVVVSVVLCLGAVTVGHIAAGWLSGAHRIVQNAVEESTG